MAICETVYLENRASLTGKGQGILRVVVVKNNASRSYSWVLDVQGIKD